LYVSFGGNLIEISHILRFHNRFRTQGSSITDTDVKLLGPRLKHISDSFLKNTQETDMHIKQVEELFDTKLKDMKRNFEEGIRRERKACEERVQKLEEHVVEERSKGETNVKALMEEHKGVVGKMEEALEEQSRQHAVIVRRHEKDFLLKQNAILSNLKKAASEETEKIQAESLVNMEKAAKEAIQRQRDFYNMEKKAEKAAAEKFQGMVKDLREKWEKDETERVANIEARIRAEVSGWSEATAGANQKRQKRKQPASDSWSEATVKVTNAYSHIRITNHFLLVASLITVRGQVRELRAGSGTG